MPATSEIFDRTIMAELSEDGRSRRQAMLIGGAALAAAAAGSLLPGGARAGAAGKTGKPIDFLFAIYPNGTLLDFAGPLSVKLGLDELTVPRSDTFAPCRLWFLGREQTSKNAAETLVVQVCIFEEKLLHRDHSKPVSERDHVSQLQS